MSRPDTDITAEYFNKIRELWCANKKLQDIIREYETGRIGLPLNPIHGQVFRYSSDSDMWIDVSEMFVVGISAYLENDK